MRSRIDWLAYAVLISALAACGSSKSTDESGSSDAGAKGDENTTSSGSAGKSSSTTGSNTTGSNTSSSTKSDAGTADTGSKSDGGTSTKSDGGSSTSSSDKGGSGGSAANSGSGNQGSTSSSNLPTDGNQLSLCSMAQGDCNKGLACSATTNALSTSRGYCSKICEKDDDCSGVDPSSSKYTCSTGTTKVCEIECSGTDDTSCPKDMTCVQTGVTARATAGAGGGGAAEPRAGAGGAGGRPSPFVGVYHCKYPLATSPLWGPCQDGEHQCDKDATCYGTGAGRAGVCTKSCTMDSDCGDKPSSGSITPSCATITPARGMMMETKLCVLSCLDKKDGCPDGTTCVDGPRAPTAPMGMGNGRGPTMGRGPGMGTAGAGGSASTSEPSYARCE